MVYCGARVVILPIFLMLASLTLFVPRQEVECMMDTGDGDYNHKTSQSPGCSNAGDRNASLSASDNDRHQQLNALISR